MKRRRNRPPLVLLAFGVGLASSCNGLLDNAPRRFDPSTLEPEAGAGATAAGAASEHGGTAAHTGGMGASAGANSAGTGANSGGAGASGANSSGGSAGEDSGGAAGSAPVVCPSSVDCKVAACAGVSCGTNGRRCAAGVCACPGGSKESSCSDGVDNDCDGAIDCADSDCPEHTQCKGSTNNRCCGGACVDTESDANNCQACGSKCASGKSCVLLSDSYGRRGHCACAGTNSLCPGYKSTSPTIICRIETPNANLCAQEAASVCPSGQTFVDVPNGPNFCHY